MNLKQTPIALLFLTATIFIAGLQAQDESKQKTDQDSNPREVLVVPLKHLDAQSGVELLNDLTEGTSTKITANVRTNSLIISGTKDRNELIKNIIAKLDVAETCLLYTSPSPRD